MTDDPLAQLRDRGQRTWRRFVPVEPLYAEVSSPARHVGQRVVLDMSLGGLKLAVRARDVRRLGIGEKVKLRLDLGGPEPIVVLGRVMHIQQVGSGWFGKWSVGLMVPLGYALDQARPALTQYLCDLASRADLEAA